MSRYGLRDKWEAGGQRRHQIPQRSCATVVTNSEQFPTRSICCSLSGFPTQKHTGLASCLDIPSPNCLLPPLLHFLFLIMVPAITHNALLHLSLCLSIWGCKLNGHVKMMSKGRILSTPQGQDLGFPNGREAMLEHKAGHRTHQPGTGRSVLL